MSKRAPSGLARFRLAALAFLLTAVLIPPARGELRIDITQGVVEPMPIAIIDFTGDDPETKRLGRDIAGVVAADLERSGLFSLVDRNAFIEDNVSMDTLPRFGDWRVINAEALVNGTVERLEDGRLRVPFRLWDVFAEKQMEGAAFSTSPKNWRRVAHIIADAIYMRVTGEKGYFDTRIVYIAETGPHDERVKRLAIMDQDGDNHRFLTDGESLVLTPRFSPTLQEITYLSYTGGIPKVYVRKVDEDRQGLVGNFPGMSFAPRFSPDGEKLIMSMADGGNSEIYSIDVRTRARKRLTNNSAIDTSPSYSPDGAADRVQFGPGRKPAVVFHGCGRDERSADQPRRWPLCHARVVSARRPGGLHQDQGRPFFHRGDEPGRYRRTPAHGRISCGGTDLGAQRQGPDVLPQGTRPRRWQRRPVAAVLHRPDRKQRAGNPDARGRFRSGVVAAAVVIVVVFEVIGCVIVQTQRRKRGLCYLKCIMEVVWTNHEWED